MWEIVGVRGVGGCWKPGNDPCPVLKSYSNSTPDPQLVPGSDVLLVNKYTTLISMSLEDATIHIFSFMLTSTHAFILFQQQCQVEKGYLEQRKNLETQDYAELPPWCLWGNGRINYWWVWPKKNWNRLSQMLQRKALGVLIPPWLPPQLLGCHHDLTHLTHCITV